MRPARAHSFGIIKLWESPNLGLFELFRSQTLISDWYGTSLWLAVVLSPVSRVSGRRSVIDRVVAFS